MDLGLGFSFTPAPGDAGNESDENSDDGNGIHGAADNEEHVEGRCDSEDSSSEEDHNATLRVIRARGERGMNMLRFFLVQSNFNMFCVGV